MALARYLYWGCDVWLNNPTRPLEACGTSGMKSALNGGLNLSIKDGWWDEGYDGRNGWAIPTADGVTDPLRRDELEAAALYDLLGQQVAPLFYERDDNGVPARWIAMVRHTLQTLGPWVQASRMVREYVQRCYLPAAETVARLTANSYAGAKDLAAYRAKVERAWPGVRVVDSELETDGRDLVVGTDVRVRATVELGGLRPDEVEVQVVLGRVGDTDQMHDIVTHPMQPDGSPQRFSATVPMPRAGSIGYTVRVLPKHELLAVPAELGKVAVQ